MDGDLEKPVAASIEVIETSLTLLLHGLVTQNTRIAGNDITETEQNNLLLKKYLIDLTDIYPGRPQWALSALIKAVEAQIGKPHLAKRIRVHVGLQYNSNAVFETRGFSHPTPNNW